MLGRIVDKFFKFFFQLFFLTVERIELSYFKSCQTCEFYHGKTYNTVFLNCAIYPDGTSKNYCDSYSSSINEAFAKEDLQKFKFYLDNYIIKSNQEFKSHLIGHYYSLDWSCRNYCYFIINLYTKFFNRCWLWFFTWCFIGSTIYFSHSTLAVILIYFVLLFNVILFWKLCIINGVLMELKYILRLGFD